MKISHINFSDNIGGASKAAKRICEALNFKGIDAQLVVLKKILDHQNTFQIGSKPNLIYSSVIRKMESIVAKNFFQSPDSSFSIHPSNAASLINKMHSDIVHFHWVNAGFLSISDIANINKPKVWTLHDMWPFCSTEHYSESNVWKNGYPNNDSGFIEKQLTQFVWNQKKKLWNQPFEIVAPSNWMADCAQNSLLFCSWPITVIKNPIDITKWSPGNQSSARQLLGLPLNKSLILFGSAGGIRDPRKGYKYLKKALGNIKKNIPDCELVVFGNAEPLFDPGRGNIKVHDMGVIEGDEKLRSIYRSGDVFVLPSLQDNLPNTCVESIACGTPVCAFDSGGVKDIVLDKKTGYLAQKKNFIDLANGINWILNKANKIEMQKNCRKHVIDHFSYSVISNQYKDVYERALYK